MILLPRKSIDYKLTVNSMFIGLLDDLCAFIGHIGMKTPATRILWEKEIGRVKLKHNIKSKIDWMAERYQLRNKWTVKIAQIKVNAFWICQIHSMRFHLHNLGVGINLISHFTISSISLVENGSTILYVNVFRMTFFPVCIQCLSKSLHPSLHLITG